MQGREGKWWQLFSLADPRNAQAPSLVTQLLPAEWRGREGSRAQGQPLGIRGASTPTGRCSEGCSGGRVASRPCSSCAFSTQKPFEGNPLLPDRRLKAGR